MPTFTLKQRLDNLVEKIGQKLNALKSSINAVSDALNDKYDKTGGTINGDVEVAGLSNQAGIYNIEDSVGRTINPKGGQIYFGYGNKTGAIKISLPVFFTNAFIRFYVDIFVHGASTKPLTIAVKGWIHSSIQNWQEPNIIILAGNSSDDHIIRFGHDGVKSCVWIGNTDTTWHSPHVVVRDFSAAHGITDSTAPLYAENWDISLVTEFDTVQHTRTNNFPYSDWNKIKNKTATGTQLVLADGSGKNQSDYLTQHQDISHLATQADLDDTNAAVDSLEDTIAEAELDILALQQNVVHKTGYEVISDEKVFEHIVMEGRNNNSVYEYSIPKEDELYSAELFSFGVISPVVVNYEIVMYMKNAWHPAEFIKEGLCNGLLGLHVNGVIIRRGYVRNNVLFEHLRSGEILYLEDVGGISTSPPPVGSSLVRRIVGYSLEKGVINFDPSHEWSVQ